MSRKRICCCVPGCKRSTARFESGEIICAKHYRLVDKKLKKLRARIRARDRRNHQPGRIITALIALRILRAEQTDAMIWERIKKQAIERAMGI
jgi:hypothetical protein